MLWPLVACTARAKSSVTKSASHVISIVCRPDIPSDALFSPFCRLIPSLRLRFRHDLQGPYPSASPSWCDQFTMDNQLPASTALPKEVDEAG
jgi:hypothetical protein